MRPSPLIAAAAGLLLSATANAYWSENHRTMNRTVINNAEPFHFDAHGAHVATVDDYLKKVLFISNGVDAKAKGVQFRKWQTPLSSGARQVFGKVDALNVEVEIDKPTDEPDTTYSLRRWNIEGAYSEDGFDSFAEPSRCGGLRAINHWHNPLSGGGLSPFFDANRGSVRAVLASEKGGYCYYTAMMAHGASAADWAAQKSRQFDSGPNNWGWETTNANYLTFLGMHQHGPYATCERRSGEASIAATMRTIGQVEHLIEDNTVPDHTRDLVHPGYGFEEFLGDHGLWAMRLPRSAWTVLPLQAIEKHGFKGIWDQDIYDNSNPASTWQGPDRVGIDEFTDANFFAFNFFSSRPHPNTLTEDDVPLGCVFTTIPNQPQIGFDSTGTTTSTNFQFPEWSNPGNPTDDYLPRYGATLPDLPFVAHKATLAGIPCRQLGNNLDTSLQRIYRADLDDEVWSHFLAPLMGRALGYATAPFKLLFQAAQASVEVDPENPSQVQVRLVNLTDGEDAITWHLQSVSLVPVIPEPWESCGVIDPTYKVVNMFDTAAESVAIGPGQAWTSTPRSLTDQEADALRHGMFTSVIVQATIGTGSTSQRISFGVPVPNAYVSMTQTTLLDETSPASYNSTTCPPTDPTCASGGGSVGTVVSPFQQNLTGKVTLLPTQLDMLGKHAEGSALNAIKASAHLAGLAVVVVDPTSTDLRRVHVAKGATLNLSGSSLSKVSDAVWLMGDSLSGTPDPASFDYEIELNLAPYGEQAQAAASALALLAWTTSGASWVQPLFVWMPFSGPADQVAALLNTCPSLGVGGSIFNAWTCSSSYAFDTSFSECRGQSTGIKTTVRAISNWSGFGGFANNWTCDEVAGVTKEQSGDCAHAPCLSQVLSCTATLSVQGTPVNGPCPAPDIPAAFPASATIHHEWGDDGLILKIALGYDQTPTETFHTP